MATPSNTTLLDAFERDPLGSTWTTVMGAGLKSGAGAYLTANNVSSGDNAGYLNTSTFGGSNLDIHLSYARNFGSGSFFELDVFSDVTVNSPDGYALGITTNGANSQRIYRIDNGAYTGLGTAYTSWSEATGDRYWLSKRGSALTAYASTDGGVWTETCSATDSTYSGPFYFGANIAADSALGGADLDNLRGGTVTAANPPPFRLRQSRLRGGDVLRGTPSGGATTWSGGDTVGLSESLPVLVSRRIAETVALTESRILRAGTALSDAVGLSDVLGSTRVVLQSVADAVAFTESRAVQVAKRFSESVAWTEAASTTRVLTKALADAVAFGEGLAKGFSRILAESVAWTENTVKSIARTFAETIGLSESLNASGGQVAVDTWTVLDYRRVRRLRAIHCCRGHR